VIVRRGLQQLCSYKAVGLSTVGCGLSDASSAAWALFGSSGAVNGRQLWLSACVDVLWAAANGRQLWLSGCVDMLGAASC
jgi:hypothetical protein